MKIMFQLTTYQNESLNSLNAKEFIEVEAFSGSHNQIDGESKCCHQSWTQLRTI